MLRKSLMLLTLAVGFGLAACSGSGPTDPNPPMMPMNGVAADTLAGVD